LKPGANIGCPLKSTAMRIPRIEFGQVYADRRRRRIRRTTLGREGLRGPLFGSPRQ
jgi:hypothetical protein